MAKDKFISGFSTVKNGVKLGYPLAESIKSILPVVDEFDVTLPTEGFIYDEILIEDVGANGDEIENGDGNGG